MTDKEQTTFEATLVFSREHSFSNLSNLDPWEPGYGETNELFTFWSESSKEHKLHMLADDIVDATAKFGRLAERIKVTHYMESVEVKDVAPYIYPVIDS